MDIVEANEPKQLKPAWSVYAVGIVELFGGGLLILDCIW